MKPNPFASLNHFTLPVAIYVPPAAFCLLPRPHAAEEGRKNTDPRDRVKCDAVGKGPLYPGSSNLYPMPVPLRFRLAPLDDLTIDDRASFSGVAIYGRLEEIVRRAAHPFRIPEDRRTASWDRALFLNLTYWTAGDGADVLCDDHIPADVVAHVAWHEVVSRELARRQSAASPEPGATAPSPPSAAALFLSESIASAFDLYLVGRLLPNAPECDFVTTQVPLMAECAGDAGMPEPVFSAMLEAVVRQPERAFEDLRALLFDAAMALVAWPGGARGQGGPPGVAPRPLPPPPPHHPP